MNGAAKVLGALAVPFLVAASAAWGGGFDRAIDAAVPRVVKLYGLGVGAQAGYGTGVLVSGDGLVLTVFSLLIDADQVRAVTSDGCLYNAQVLRRDTDRQLALLRLEATDASGWPSAVDDGSGPVIGPFPFFKLATGGIDESRIEPDPDRKPPPALQPGDWVVSAGNPFKIADGAEPVSLTHGVFSARTHLDARRKVKEFPYRGDVLVIDAITSNPGAPGSAVVDLDGRFVGMVGREVVSNLTHTHFNYAVPRNVLYEFFREATNSAAPPTEAPSSPRAENATTAADGPTRIDLGFRLVRTGYRSLPPIVDRIRPGSPAARAGVQKDDVIISVSGKNVADVEEFEARVRQLAPGDPVDLMLRRGRNMLSVRLEAPKP